MQINIIHNPLRQDRFNLLIKEFIQQDFENRFWPAIILDKPFTGIMAAHQAIVRDAKNRNLPMVCIGEDDLCFTASGAWKYFLSQMPDDFDIYLASVYGGDLKSDNTCTWLAGLTLYVIHSRFYDKFLSIPEGRHIDRALKDLGKFVVCNPFCCIQHETYSENQKKVLNNKKYLNGKKVFDGYDENGNVKTRLHSDVKLILHL